MKFDANDLIMDISFLDGTFQKGTNSLGLLHYRNLDHGLLTPYSLDLTPSDLICSPN